MAAPGGSRDDAIQPPAFGPGLVAGLFVALVELIYMEPQGLNSAVSHRFVRLAFKYQVSLSVAISFLLLLGLVYTQINWIQQRHDFIDTEKQTNMNRGVVIDIAIGPAPGRPRRAPSFLWLFGEEGARYVVLLTNGNGTRMAGRVVEYDKPGGQKFTKNDIDRARRAKTLFPEAEILISYEPPLSESYVPSP